jgi:hypothetical protein
MTESELLAWGKHEHVTRMADIERVKAGLLPLIEAQEAANNRSRMAGLSPGATDRALRLARNARS